MTRLLQETRVQLANPQKRIHSSLLDGAGAEAPNARRLRRGRRRNVRRGRVRSGHHGRGRAACRLVGRQSVQVFFEQAGPLRCRRPGSPDGRAIETHAGTNARARGCQGRSRARRGGPISRTRRRAARLLLPSPSGSAGRAFARSWNPVRVLPPQLRGKPRRVVPRIRERPLPRRDRHCGAPLRVAPRLRKLRERRGRNAAPVSERGSSSFGDRSAHRSASRWIETSVRNSRRSAPCSVAER